MGKIGKFDKNFEALKKRVNSHEKFGKSDLNKWVFSNLNLSNSPKILDLGCGFGKQTIELLKMNCEVTAIDASRSSINQLKKVSSTKNINKKLSTIITDFDKLKLISSNYDIIISIYAFYYAKDKEKLLSKVYKKLKPGGVILICGPSYENNKGMKNLLRKSGIDFDEGSAPFMEEQAPKMFKKLFNNVKKLTFKNTLTFPNAKSVWDYWSCHNMFDASIEQIFKENLKLHFSKNKDFKTTKVVRGILSKKT